jgi:hypothetical protein
MAGVFQNIDPLTARRVCAPLVRGEDTLARGRGGWGVNILEDARHSSVLYVCKYFVIRVLQSNINKYGTVLVPPSLQLPTYN